MSLYAIAKREVDALSTPTEQPPPEPGGGPVGTAVLEPAPPARPAGAVPVGTPGVGQALSSIGTYIPTEVMATYLAILAAIPSDRGPGFQWLMRCVSLIF